MSAASSVAFARMSVPYGVVMREATPSMRSDALSSPLSASTITHTSARVLKRRIAIAASSGKRITCEHTAMRPPTHTPTASRWMKSDTDAEV